MLQKAAFVGRRVWFSRVPRGLHQGFPQWGTRFYSRKGKDEDPRAVEAQGLLGDLDEDQTNPNPRNIFGAGSDDHPAIEEIGHGFRETPVQRVGEDDDEIEGIAGNAQYKKQAQAQSLDENWIFDREKKSYFNPNTGEVRMPFWKSKANHAERRADRYARIVAEQDQQPLPFFGDQTWSNETQFYWEHEMARIRKKYNHLDFDELDKVLSEADSRFFVNQEDYNIIPFGPVVRNNTFGRGEEELKEQEDKFNTFLLPAKYHVKDFTRVHGSKVGRKMGFGTLIIAGNRKGVAGYGYGKGKDLMQATRMASKDVVKNLIDIPLDENRTIYSSVVGTYGTTKVILCRAKRGHGITGGTLIWALADCLGIQDLTSKVYGSKHPLHVCYAFFRALVQTKSLREDALLRGMNYVNMYQNGVRTFNPPGYEAQKVQEANVRRFINTANEQWRARQGLSAALVEEADEIRAMHEESGDEVDVEGFDQVDDADDLLEGTN
eukprot:CAMPEP_0175153160 /NCGR_PEP_ID=MMETSP0087-20121206/19564_1 /TAXON_ID=136419 /ORGANISM="Unknown Unknown, Strain D1" /LENGTH=491 /DNA_ID=CAMNT_0016439771 /DNA_START=59 /DNA_END=1534 /DNA_ORIENTATION=-